MALAAGRAVTGRRAVFLDKDGTLVEDIPYSVDPARIALLPGAIAGTRALHEAGYALVIVSNQSGVARGLFDESALAAAEVRIRQLLARGGGPLAGFYVCPHHPEGVVERYRVRCDCRKPAPGLLLRAAADLGIDLRASWIVGDILNDVEAGHRAGCRAVLVNNGGETEWRRSPLREPEAVVATMNEAAAAILRIAGEDARTGRRQEVQGAAEPVADR